MVTFGKRAQTSGVFTTHDYMPKMSWRVFNDTPVDPLKVLQFETILKTIESEKLLERVKVVGEHLRKELKSTAGVSDVRGLGT